MKKLSRAACIKIKKSFALASALILIVSFQNCGGDFTVSSDQLGSASFNTDGGEQLPPVSPTPEPTQTATPQPSATPTPPPTATPTPAPTGRNYSNDRSLFFGNSRCNRTDLDLCEDFENGTISSNWTTVGTKPIVDSVQAARGVKALHITKTGPGRSYIQQAKTFPAAKNSYYGRMFVYFKTVPDATLNYLHWTVIASNGTVNPAEIRVGGQWRNKRNLFGVGTDNALGTGDWTRDIAAPDPVEEVPKEKWICLEWLHKGDTNETKLWWDGVEKTSLATTATNHGGIKTKQYLLPEFNKMWVGWDSYQASTLTYELFVDEVAIDSERIGCVD